MTRIHIWGGRTPYKRVCPRRKFIRASLDPSWTLLGGSWNLPGPSPRGLGTYWGGACRTPYKRVCPRRKFIRASLDPSWTLVGGSFYISIHNTYSHRYMHPCIILSIQSVYLSIYPSIYVCMYISFYLSIYLSI